MSQHFCSYSVAACCDHWGSSKTQPTRPAFKSILQLNHNFTCSLDQTCESGTLCLAEQHLTTEPQRQLSRSQIIFSMWWLCCPEAWGIFIFRVKDSYWGSLNATSQLVNGSRRNIDLVIWIFPITLPNRARHARSYNGVSEIQSCPFILWEHLVTKP